MGQRPRQPLRDLWNFFNTGAISNIANGGQHTRLLRESYGAIKI
ncbi:MAG TPA: hypothetical protein VJ723_04985 [Candidatus Angelobacter sp.]|nr:hypothetical protein [Candidatus Angelobacter sp.]